MTFDWQTFLDSRGISYRQHGRELRVDCPWCRDGGAPNMSINRDGAGWKCWANAEHSGHGPVTLMVQLTGMPAADAYAMAGRGAPLQAEAFSRDKIVDILMRKKELEFDWAGDNPAQRCQLPPDFVPIANTAAARPFVDYLVRRGFAPARVLHFTRDHGLYYARHGRWHYRVILAIVMDGRLRGWTGRSIADSITLRYLAAGADDGAVPPPMLVPWIDQLTGGRRLIICEGPFDAIKLRELGEHATCCFTSAPSRAQIDFLRAVLPRYRDRVLLLDRGTLATALTVQRDTAGLGLRIVSLTRYKDPCEISTREELEHVLHG